MKNAYEQLTEAARHGVAALIGAEDCAAFRNNLRDMPPLKDGFTLGQMANAYMLARLLYLNSL